MQHEYNKATQGSINAQDTNTNDNTPSQDVIQLYLEYMPYYLKALHSALSEENQEQIMFHCHKIISPLRIMQYDDIADMLVNIERHQPKGQALEQQCQHITNCIEQTLTKLAKQHAQ